MTDQDELDLMVGDLATCAELLRQAWLVMDEDQLGWLVDRLDEHVARLRQLAEPAKEVQQ